ncbi:hypothetical protein M9458_021752, partial [Cirrhinus mrigala]
IRSLPDVAMTGNCSQERLLDARPATPLNCPRFLGRLANGSVRLGGEENRPRLPPSRSAYSSSDHAPSDHAPLEESSRLPAPPPITPRNERYTCEKTTPTIFD